MTYSYPIPPGEIWSDKIPGIAAESVPLMTIVPAGEFVIGSAADENAGQDTGIDAARPQRQVHIRYVLAVGIHPITVQQFEAFASEKDYAAGGEARIALEGLGQNSPVITGAGWRTPGFPQGPTQPVTCVSWQDANAYVGWLNDRLNLEGELDAYRLLSESEWEYVCRANPNGTAAEPPFSFGYTVSTDQANFDGNRDSRFGPRGLFRAATTRTGTFSANAFGLSDLHGNVWEWCQDVQTDSYDALPPDGSPQTKTDLPKLFPRKYVGRVIRGGSWVNDASVLQSAYRSRAAPTERTNYLGFRVARTMR